MLFKILDTIRTKPKHVRDQYAFGIAVFCTMAIGGVWTLSLPARFASDSQVAAIASSTNAAPFSNFLTQLKQQFSGVKQAINELPLSTTTPGTSIASTTQAALDLQLSPETKAELDPTVTTPTGTKIEFGTGTGAATNTTGEGMMQVGTSSGTTTPSRL